MQFYYLSACAKIVFLLTLKYNIMINVAKVILALIVTVLVNNEVIMSVLYDTLEVLNNIKV